MEAWLRRLMVETEREASRAGGRMSSPAAVGMPLLLLLLLVVVEGGGRSSSTRNRGAGTVGALLVLSEIRLEDFLKRRKDIDPLRVRNRNLARDRHSSSSSSTAAAHPKPPTSTSTPPFPRPPLLVQTRHQLLCLSIREIDPHGPKGICQVRYPDSTHPPLHLLENLARLSFLLPVVQVEKHKLRQGPYGMLAQDTFHVPVAVDERELIEGVRAGFAGGRGMLGERGARRSSGSSSSSTWSRSSTGSDSSWCYLVLKLLLSLLAVLLVGVAAAPQRASRGGHGCHLLAGWANNVFQLGD